MGALPDTVTSVMIQPRSAAVTEALARIFHDSKIQQRDVELSVAFVGLATLLVLLTVVAAARWTAFPT